MEHNEMRKLLEKYWAGETDLSEEKLLQDFFAQKVNLPADLQAEANLFGFYKETGNLHFIHTDLIERLKQHWENGNRKVEKRLLVWKQIRKYAALLIVLLMCGYFFMRKNERKNTELVKPETFEDPQKALMETEKVLLLLSQNMNEGMSKMEILKSFDELTTSDKFKQTGKVINKK